MASTHAFPSYRTCFSYKPNCADSDEYCEERNVIIDEPEELHTNAEMDEDMKHLVTQHSDSKHKHILKLVDNRYSQPQFFCPMIAISEHTVGTLSTDEVDHHQAKMMIREPATTVMAMPSEKIATGDIGANKGKYIPLRLVNNTHWQPNFFFPKLQQ